MAPRMKTQCRGKNVAGEPCGANAGTDEFCYFHRPGRVATEARREARRVGGVNAHVEILPVEVLEIDAEDPRAIVRALVTCAAQVHAGTLDPRRGNAVGFLLGQAAKVLHGQPPPSTREALADFRSTLVGAVLEHRPELAGQLADVLELVAREHDDG